MDFIGTVVSFIGIGLLGLALGGMAIDQASYRVYRHNNPLPIREWDNENR